jgi:hypothetical protein
MSRVVIIEKNKDGKIELTKDELQQMLDDAYNQGYADGNRKYDTITYPSKKCECQNHPVGKWRGTDVTCEPDGRVIFHFNNTTEAVNFLETLNPKWR